MQCNTAQQACTCAAGTDTCYGYCIPTPCGACNTCVKNVRAFTATVRFNKSSAAVALAWDAACKGTLQRTSTSCEFVRAQILASQDGNLGKRAGAICQLLQDCTAVPSDCKLESPVVNGQASGLELCTIEGTTVNSSQVPDVHSPATFVLPEGSCFDTADCSKWPGQVCNKLITRDVQTCTGGVDGFMTLGSCVRTPCQTCKVSPACIALADFSVLSLQHLASECNLSRALLAWFVTHTSPGAGL